LYFSVEIREGLLVSLGSWGGKRMGEEVGGVKPRKVEGLPQRKTGGFLGEKRGIESC